MKRPHTGIKPISPEEVIQSRQQTLPVEVIMAYNTLITENWTGSVATFNVDRTKKRILENFAKTNTTVPSLPDHWFNIKPLYEAKGWQVTVTKPCYDHQFSPFYTFSVPF